MFGGVMPAVPSENGIQMACNDSGKIAAVVAQKTDPVNPHPRLQPLSKRINELEVLPINRLTVHTCCG
jgi:hypothetical protein